MLQEGVMEYILFSLWFTLIHTGTYTLAGMAALNISRDLYEGEQRLLDFLIDMSEGEKDESGRVKRFFLPAQLLRGLLMSLVLYPVMPLLGDISFAGRFAFFFGLMFIYTDFAGAVPFPHNIEGFVYMKSRYLQKKMIWKLYFEIIIYSLLFALCTAWLLF